MNKCFLSPAKLNLFLKILNKRKDGYHNILTLYQFIDYYDKLLFKIHRNKHINLKSNIPLQCDVCNNLIVKAAILLKNKAMHEHIIDDTFGVDIFLYKNIPVNSGLGGGSSNAATTLIALNHLWKLNYKLTDLLKIGNIIGADVPVFVYGKSTLAKGTGQIFINTPIVHKKWYLVIYPKIKITSKTIYERLKVEDYKNMSFTNRMLPQTFTNDLQLIAENEFPILKEILVLMSRYAKFRLTGTGSCMFAEFESKISAQQIIKKIPNNLYYFITKSIDVSPLHKLIQIIDQ